MYKERPALKATPGCSKPDGLVLAYTYSHFFTQNIVNFRCIFHHKPEQRSYRKTWGGENFSGGVYLEPICIFHIRINSYYFFIIYLINGNLRLDLAYRMV